MVENKLVGNLVAEGGTLIKKKSVPPCLQNLNEICDNFPDFYQNLLESNRSEESFDFLNSG